MAIPWDAKAHFLPQVQFLAQSLARGDSPFWSPYVFAGHPQVADPQSLLFAPTFLLLALLDGSPDPWLVDMLLLAMVVAGGVFLMLWARDQRWHWGGALVAALCFCWGASMAWRIQHVGQVLSLAWLPIALFCLERSLQRRSSLWGLLTGLVIARIALGRDQVAMLGLYLLAAYAIWRIVSTQRARGALMPDRRTLLSLGVTGLVALAASALPILLTALLAQDSNRPEISLTEAGRGSLHPALLLTLLVPDVFGATGRGDDYWGPPSAAWPGTGLFLAQNMGGLYIGALPAILVLAGALRGWLWRREIRFFTFAAIAMGVYALGWYTPVFSALHAWLPGISLFRRPADATFLFGAALSILAGYSAHHLLTRENGAGKPAQTALLASAVTLSILAFTSAGWLAFAHERVARVALPLAEALLSIGLATIVVTWVARRGKDAPRMAAVLIAALTTADLAYHNGPSSATAQPAAMYEVLDPDSTNATIAALKARVVADDLRRDRVELTGLGFHWPNASLTHGLENILGYNPLRLGYYSAATGAEDHVGLPDQRRFSPLFPSSRCQLANLLGLRFIATGVPIEEIDRKLGPGDLKLVAKTGNAWIYENPAAMPRVMFATQAFEADFDQIIASGQWPAVDLESTVLLEQRAEQPALHRRPGQARLLRYANTEIDIEVDSPDGGWLVLNDIWHPWWFAQSEPDRDGPELEVLRANVLFRAVVVAPGRHRVRFEFRPREGAWQQLSGGRDP
ncbi:MAG: hypothetical protein ACKODB_05400 [Betaproteobacteria bacterium]